MSRCLHRLQLSCLVRVCVQKDIREEESEADVCPREPAMTNPHYFFMFCPASGKPKHLNALSASEGDYVKSLSSELKERWGDLARNPCSRCYISLKGFLRLCSGFWLPGLMLEGCMLLGPFREVGTDMGIQAGYSTSLWEFAVAHVSKN